MQAVTPSSLRQPESAEVQAVAAVASVQQFSAGASAAATHGYTASTAVSMHVEVPASVCAQALSEATGPKQSSGVPAMSQEVPSESFRQPTPSAAQATSPAFGSKQV